MRLRCVVVPLMAVCPLVLIAAGCGTGQSPSGERGHSSGNNAASASRPSGVAVVDLDEVAKQLGRDVVLSNQISAGQASLNQQLLTFQATLQQKYQQKEQQQQQQKQNQQQQKQQQTQQDQTRPQVQKKNQMPKEEADRILDVMRNSEKDIQKNIRKRQAVHMKVEKDW